MADISEELQIIAEGRYGDDVKNAIIEAIQKLNNEAFNSVKEIREYMKVVTPLLNKFTVCPSGTLSISVNGSYDVADYDMADVEVPIPPGLFDGTYDFGPSLYMSPIWSIRNHAFQGFSKLYSVAFPNVEEIGQYAFANCIYLSNASFPECSVVGDFAFADCDELPFISLPKCEHIEQKAFIRCENLKTVYISRSPCLKPGAFSSCRKLMSIYFTYPPTVYGEASDWTTGDVFYGTPMLYSGSISSNYGSIYVLSRYLSQYLTHSFWGDLSSRFTTWTPV